MLLRHAHQLGLECLDLFLVGDVEHLLDVFVDVQHELDVVLGILTVGHEFLTVLNLLDASLDDGALEDVFAEDLFDLFGDGFDLFDVLDLLLWLFEALFDFQA